MLHHVVWLLLTDVSEELTAAIIRVMGKQHTEKVLLYLTQHFCVWFINCPDEGGSKLL
jgi:hypothetical protein